MMVSGDRSQMMVMIKHRAWNVNNLCSSTQKSADACTVGTSTECLLELNDLPRPGFGKTFVLFVFGA